MAERRTPAPLIDGLGTRARAYVQVQNGCDHRCTFCIIPYGRGNSRSVPAATVVEQIARLVGPRLQRGGADRRRPDELGRRPRRRAAAGRPGRGDPAPGARPAAAPPLLDRLGRGRSAADRGDRRRAAADAAPAPVAAGRRRPDPQADEAAAPAATTPSPSARRSGRRAPDVVFGADIIAGFPTETEAMFENSLRLVEECGLTWLHVFPFSPRAGHARGADAAGRRPGDPRPRGAAAGARRRARRRASRRDAGTARCSC